jgi:hypothetical protein
MVKILSVSRAQARLPKLISTLQEREDEVKETLDVLGDPELMRQILQSEAEIDAGKKGLSFEEVFGESLAPRRRKRSR